MTDTTIRQGASETAPFSLKPLMFQTFACAMAMMSFTALVGPIGRALDLAPWMMGTAVTAGGLAWALAAAPWGRASDRLGRRPILLMGLSGFALSYAVMCLVTSLALRGWIAPLPALGGLILCRGLTGAFYAAVPSAGVALISDHVAPERRAGAIATLGAVGGVSMVAGPALTALLAPIALELPLYVIGALPVLAPLVLWRLLPRDGAHPPSGGAPPRLSDPRLRHPLVAGFLCMLGVATAQIVIGFLVIDRLGLSPTEGARLSGIALVCVGVALTGSQSLVRFLPFTPATLIRLGAMGGSAGFMVAAFAPDAPSLCAGYFLAAAGMGLAWPSIPALAANAVKAHERGAAAGAVAAAQGMGPILGPLLGTGLYDLDTAAPLLTAAVLLVALALWRPVSPVSEKNS